MRSIGAVLALAASSGTPGVAARRAAALVKPAAAVVRPLSADRRVMSSFHDRMTERFRNRVVGCLASDSKNDFEALLSSNRVAPGANINGIPLVALAVMARATNVAVYLIDECKVAVGSCDYLEGKTLLHLAVEFGNHSLICFLGRSVEAWLIKDLHGQTPFDLLKHSGLKLDSEFVKAIECGADKQARDLEVLVAEAVALDTDLTPEQFKMLIERS